jgi:hypothetical protein
MTRRFQFFSLLTVAGLMGGTMVSRRLLIQSVAAQGASQNMEIRLTERGAQKLQLLPNGTISSTRDRIEFKEHYILVTGKEPDKRTWVLAVDDIKVMVAGN